VQMLASHIVALAREPRQLISGLPSRRARAP